MASRDAALDGRATDISNASSVSFGALATAFCVGGALALVALSSTRLARAQSVQGPADGAAPMQAPLQVVAPVDFKRYAGLWYEQARLPNSFEKDDAVEVTAKYTLQPDGTLQVHNRSVRPGGQVDEVTGAARVVTVVGQSGAGRLKVRFAPEWLSWLPQVWGDYWILKLDRDYKVALVGAPNRNYLWVLSRAPHLDEPTLAAELDYARTLGFEVDKVERTLKPPAISAD